MRQKPTVLASEIVAKSRLFAVEELQLRFSNGVERTYERLVGKGQGYGAVMVVAMLDAEHAVLVEEYCAGVDEYQLSLPKGLVEPGEDILAAANRELKEEAGYGARQLEHITELSLSPGYIEPAHPGGAARDLYEERCRARAGADERRSHQPARTLEPGPARPVQRRPCPGRAVPGARGSDRAVPLAAAERLQRLRLRRGHGAAVAVHGAPDQRHRGDLFGVRNLSMLGGIVFLFHQLGAFLGGWLGGVVYDAPAATTWSGSCRSC